MTLAILYIILVKSKSNRNVHRVPTCEIRGSIKILQEFELSMQNTFYITLPFAKHLYPEIDPMKRTILLLVWWTVYIYSMLSLIFWLFEINRSILDSLWLILYISKIILFDDWCVTIMNWWMILIHIVSPRHKIMSNDYHAIKNI